jgi:predicted CxxxxCH...CXXCH cytochrome family protein
MAHPKPWNNHSLSGNQANACALCHGATFGGGNGPACMECHVQLVAGALPALSQCISCHGKPPAGTTTPDRAGSHGAHAVLQELSGTCSPCHSGGGFGSVVHRSFSNHTAARVVLIPAYNAKSGSAKFTRGTMRCENVSCHGGQTTPPWGTTLNVTTACLACHGAGTVQYNGYFSGQHDFHLSIGLFCTDCHDMSGQALPSHFSNLSSPALNQPAAATLRGYLNYTKTAPSPSCLITTAPPPGTVFTACHSSQKTW